MKKQLIAVLLIFGLSAGIVGCTEAKRDADNQGESKVVKVENSKVLIGYFTRLDNTNGDIDAVLKGGGPYGDLGHSLEDADVDAISSASITVEDGEARGNTEMLARMIQKKIGGDLFSIETKKNYPTDYNTLVDEGEEENKESARLELKNQVKNMDDYDVIFLGFPNWWFDMPMPVYSFLEAYDFSGKTVIPFVTSASSGFSDTISEIKKALPESEVNENGLHIQMEEVKNGQDQVTQWLEELGMKE